MSVHPIGSSAPSSSNLQDSALPRESYVNTVSASSVSEKKTSLGEDGETDLTRAIMSGQSRLVADALEKEGVDVNQANKKGFPPLILAVILNNIPMINLLLENPQIEGDAMDAKNNTAMNWAAMLYPSLIDVLSLSGKCDPNGRNIPPIKTAIAYSQNESARRLLNILSIDPNKTGDSRKSSPTELSFAKLVSTEKNRATPEDKTIAELLLKNPRTNTSDINTLYYLREGPEYKEIRKLLKNNHEEYFLTTFLPKAAHELKIEGRLKLHPKGKKRNLSPIFRNVISRKVSTSDLKENLPNEPDHRKVNSNQSCLKVNLENTYGRIFFHSIAKSIHQYSTQEKSSLDKTTADLLTTAYKDCSWKRDSEETLKRIQRNDLTFLETGFLQHSVMVVFCGKYFILCNRGAESRNAVEIYEYDIKSLNTSILERIKDCSTKYRVNYQKLFFQDLHDELHLKSTEATRKIEKKCTLPPQVVGNCTWESAETSVWSSLILSNLLGISNDKINGNDDLSLEKVKRVVSNQTQVFWNWLAFEQLKQAEKLLKIRDNLKEYKIPNHFIFHVFYNAHETLKKSTEQKTHERFSNLKKEHFFQSLSRLQKIHFKALSLFWNIKSTTGTFLNHLDFFLGKLYQTKIKPIFHYLTNSRRTTCL